jgi:hypothetical protein
MTDATKIRNDNAPTAAWWREVFYLIERDYRVLIRTPAGLIDAAEFIEQAKAAAGRKWKAA